MIPFRCPSCLAMLAFYSLSLSLLFPVCFSSPVTARSPSLFLSRAHPVDQPRCSAFELFLFLCFPPSRSLTCLPLSLPLLSPLQSSFRLILFPPSQPAHLPPSFSPSALSAPATLLKHTSRVRGSLFDMIPALLDSMIACVSALLLFSSLPHHGAQVVEWSVVLVDDRSLPAPLSARASSLSRAHAHPHAHPHAHLPAPPPSRRRPSYLVVIG